MTGTEELIKIHGDPASGSMDITYKPKTTRTIFDICDVNGRILQTGPISDEHTSINLSQLTEGQQYIILVLDGDMILSRRFKM